MRLRLSKISPYLMVMPAVAPAEYNGSTTIQVVVGKSVHGSLPVGLISNVKVRVIADCQGYTEFTNEIAEGKTNTSGIATIKLDYNNFRIPPGSYPLRAIVIDDSYQCGDTTNSVHVTFKTAATKLHVSGPDSAQLGDILRLKAKLIAVNTGKPVVGRKLHFMGYSVSTNNEGEAEFAIKLEPGMPLGAQTYAVKYFGTEPQTFWKASEGSKTVQIKPSAN